MAESGVLSAIASSFDNRDIAIAVWTLLGVLGILSVKAVRASIRPLLSVALVPAISISLLLTALYVVMVSMALRHFGLWSAADLKDTVLWTGGFAFVTLFELPDLHRNPAGFRRVLKEIVALTIFLEFATNLFVMELWLELLLVPFVTLVGLMLGYAQLKKEHASVARFLTGVQVLVGLAIVVFVGIQLRYRFSEVLTIETARQEALPIALSILFIPFLYVMTVYTAYDSIWRRLKWAARKPDVRQYARLRTLWICNINLRRLARWSRRLGFANLSTRANAEAAIRQAVASNGTSQLPDGDSAQAAEE